MLKKYLELIVLVLFSTLLSTALASLPSVEVRSADATSNFAILQDPSPVAGETLTPSVFINSSVFATASGTTVYFYTMTSSSVTLLSSINTDHTKNITSIAYSSNSASSVLITGSNDTKCKVWNVNTLSTTPLLTFTAHTGAIYKLVAMWDGRSVASISADNTLKVWSWMYGNVSFSASVSAGSRSIVQVADSMLAVGETTGNVKMLNLKTGVAVKTITQTITRLMSLTNAMQMQSADVIFVGNKDGYVSQWQWTTGTLLGSVLACNLTQPCASISSCSITGLPVFDMIIMSNGKLLVQCDAKNVTVLDSYLNITQQISVDYTTMSIMSLDANPYMIGKYTYNTINFLLCIGMNIINLN